MAVPVICNQGVAGSSPAGGTSFFKDLWFAVAPLGAPFRVLKQIVTNLNL